MTITIRKCTLADIPALQAISRETFADTFGSENSPEDLANYLDESYSQAQLKQELQDPNSEFYFAYDDDQLAAYLKVNVGDSQTEEMGKNAFEIQRIYVLPQFKRRHIGSQLMTKALELARQHHSSTVWLGVWEYNLPAQGMYKHFGFKQTGDRVFTLGESRQRDLIMTKTL